MDSRADEIIKKIQRLDRGHGRLTSMLSTHELRECELKWIIKTLYGIKNDPAKPVLGSIIKSLLIENKFIFKLSLNDVQSLINKDPDIPEKINLLNNGRKTWEGLTALYDKDLSFFRILEPSSKNGKRPAIVTIYEPLIWDSLETINVKDIEDIYASSKLEIPHELDPKSNQLRSFKEYKVQIDKFLNRTRDQEDNITKDNKQNTSKISNPDSAIESNPISKPFRTPISKPFRIPIEKSQSSSEEFRENNDDK